MENNEIPTTPVVTEPAAQPDSGPTPMNVINPEGRLVSIHPDQVADAVEVGYQIATPDQVHTHAMEQQYGSFGQQAITGAEAAGKAATFGLSTGLETALGVNPEDIRGREETNPVAKTIGEVVGLAGSALIPGVGEANLLEKAGAGAAKAIGLAGGESVLSKIGSGAVKLAVENSLYGSGDEVSKMLAKDPDQTAQSALINVGLNGVLGGGLGSALGSVSPLWHATMGPKLESALEHISARVGGTEGAVPGAMQQAIDATGLNIAPEIKAALSGKPELERMFKHLQQSDTTGSGKQLQETYTKFTKDLGDSLVTGLGHNPKSIPGEFSKYEAGKSVGDTLAKEWDKNMSPLSKEFEALKEKYTNQELFKDAVVKGETDFTNPYSPVARPDRVIPGTTTQLGEKIGQLAQEQGWTASPSSDIMREVNRTLRELPSQTTLKDLSSFITAVGNNTASTLGFGQQTPLSRAGQLIRNILKDGESEVALQRLGSEAPELVERYKIARDAYREQSILKEALDDRLKIGGSASGFGKGLRAMAKEDGEKLWQRLNGKGDAFALDFLSKNFPETANKIRQSHVEAMLERAGAKAKDGEAINIKQLLKETDALSPELKAFVLPAEAQTRIQGAATIMDRLEKLPHNFSNTARTLDSLTQHIPGSAMALAALLSGHGGAAAILGPLTHMVSHNAPDAVRLGMLKWLGANQPAGAQGFKAMVDYIQHGIDGHQTIVTATKNLFKASAKVIPDNLMPDAKDREKLDKRLKALQADPQALLETGGHTGTYLPDHQVAIGQTAAQAVSYLNANRPTPKRLGPLDPPAPVNTTQKAAYDRLLNIAQQPLIVMKDIKDGTLTAKDVQALQTMYPALYQKLSSQLQEHMVAHVAKDEPIPYRTRISLSTFLNTPLDASLKPISILAAQPEPQGAPQGQESNGGAIGASGKKPSDTSMNAMRKSITSSQTPVQAAQARTLAHQ